MAQTERDSRWITVREPFDYYWPGRQAVTHYSEPGEIRVKNEVADFAVAKGKATEGKVDGSDATPPPKKAKRKTKAKKASKVAGDATTADTRAVAPVGDQGAADADRSADRPAVDSDAG